MSIKERRVRAPPLSSRQRVFQTSRRAKTDADHKIRGGTQIQKKKYSRLSDPATPHTFPASATARSAATVVLSSWLGRFPCSCEAAATSPSRPLRQLLPEESPGSPATAADDFVAVPDVTFTPRRLRSLRGRQGEWAGGRPSGPEYLDAPPDPSPALPRPALCGGCMVLVVVGCMREGNVGLPRAQG